MNKLRKQYLKLLPLIGLHRESQQSARSSEKLNMFVTRPRASCIFVACEALERTVSIDDVQPYQGGRRLGRGCFLPVDDGRQFDVVINGADRTWRLVNKVNGSGLKSRLQGARNHDGITAENRVQRRIVVLGRDIGTVVLPDAV